MNKIFVRPGGVVVSESQVVQAEDGSVVEVPVDASSRGDSSEAKIAAALLQTVTQSMETVASSSEAGGQGNFLDSLQKTLVVVATAKAQEEGVNATDLLNALTTAIANVVVKSATTSQAIPVISTSAPVVTKSDTETVNVVSSSQPSTEIIVPGTATFSRTDISGYTSEQLKNLIGALQSNLKRNGCTAVAKVALPSSRK